METVEMTHDDFVAQWQKNNRTVTRNGISMRFTRLVQSHGDPEMYKRLNVGDTNWRISSGSTIADIAQAAGIKTFDVAFPIGWLRETYWDKGLDTPIGVWSYDENKVFGDFVSLQTMFEKMEIAKELSD